jgi:CRP-like cAMP-binding protein
MVLRLLRTDLKRLLEQFPSFAQAVSEHVVDLYRRAEEQIELIASGNLDQKVRRLLRLLAPQAPSSTYPNWLCLTQADVAALAGASRQHVNRILVILRREGLIAVCGGRILVFHPPSGAAHSV